MSKKFFLTTAIPYVNANPHCGHALEYVMADVIHRYHETVGDEVFFVSGADENALKNVQAAEKVGMEPDVFLDKYAKVFQDFYKLLEADLDEFRRGTDQVQHWPGVQELWKLTDKNGDIYKKKYKGLYCVGCESFKTKDDLVDGKCPDHNKEPEVVEEENYFFRLSKYQDKLIKLIESDTLKIEPEKCKREVLSFIILGLEDFSISRSNQRARGIGVPVPGDDSQKMYVWFDALNIYQTAVGWGYDQKLYKKWWPADLHVIGKDIIRFHAVYWPAMLMSAKLQLPKSLLVHGFITSGGKKMSKSIGNVVDPYAIIKKFGVEAFRYYLLSQIPTQDDGDLTEGRMNTVYVADLQNGLGNLVSRVAAMASGMSIAESNRQREITLDVGVAIKLYRFDIAMGRIWDKIKKADQFVSEQKVWELKGKEKEGALVKLVGDVRQIAVDLSPFMPETAEKISKQFGGEKIVKSAPLFPRLT
ncbi:MAG: methionine--tRNA ligase [bacterium]